MSPRRRLRAWAASSSLASLAACASSHPAPVPPAPVDPVAAQALPAFDGATGERLDWAAIRQRLLSADVIFIGETHDNPDAHAFEQAVVLEVMEGSPSAAVSLEMLERDEQALVDQWLAGAIGTEELVARSGSANWSGFGSWMPWYQPMLDAAAAHGGRVIAANAPRALVRCAREQGFEAIELPPDPDSGECAIPLVAHEDAAYFQRFLDVMQGMAGEDGNAVDEQSVRDGFRGQTTWDATMASSIARARAAGQHPVVHAVGSFHVQYRGGTLLEFLARRPTDRTLTFVVVPEASTALRPEEVGMADIVVYGPAGLR